jgi:hypothetical protein
MHSAVIVYSVEAGRTAVQAAITFGFVVLLGGAAGVVWTGLNQRRQLDLTSLARFYDTYGSWFATWCTWTALMEGKLQKDEVERKRDELLAQAAAVEGQFEALLVKIANERHLNPDQLRHLGRFREGYQQLRESIEKREKLPFRVQYDATQQSAYVAFKALTVEFATLLARSSWSRRPKLPKRQEAFVQVTSWRVAGGEKSMWFSDSAEVLTQMR